jgi:hypothetical protein
VHAGGGGGEGPIKAGFRPHGGGETGFTQIPSLLGDEAGEFVGTVDPSAVQAACQRVRGGKKEVDMDVGGTTTPVQARHATEPGTQHFVH